MDNQNLATYMEAADEFTNAFAKGMQEFIVKKSIPLVVNEKIYELSKEDVRKLAFYYMFEYVSLQVSEQMQRHTKVLLEK